MKPSKKTSKTQMSVPENPTVEEVLRSQINLYQYCNDLGNRLREMEIHVQHMDFQNQMMKRDNFEVKSLLGNLGNHLKSLHESGRQMMDSPSPVQDDKSQPMMKKALPLHDDVMTNCDVCSGNHHLNLKTCPHCGFERAKG